MRYLVKWVVLVPVDSGADPESAGIARAIFSSPVLRSIEFHRQNSIGQEELDSMIQKFDATFKSGGEPGLIERLKNGPNALNICGFEIHSREDMGAGQEEWRVVSVWRKAI